MNKIKNYENSGIPGDDEVLFLSLGGIGSIGSNMYVYGHRGKWLIVDYGIGFAGDNIPGIDITFADPKFLEERKEDILGMVITHAHEDHIGALSYMYDKVDCPIYATGFTADMIKHKLKDGGFSSKKLNVLKTGDKFKVGDFELEFVEMTHSIPEPQALLIKTSVGNIFHTGDWKIDENPVVGHCVNKDRLNEIGQEGLLALVGDSTNVMSKFCSESEGDIKQGIYETIKAISGGVAVTCFASNVARISSIIDAGIKCNRKIVLVGRSLFRVIECARNNGYLQNLPEFYEPEDVVDCNKKDLLYICTGSQGESRAGLARIARGDHRYVKLGTNDNVIFSARSIPGNEISIATVQNMLVERGVHIITPSDAMVHASGHGAREEMRELYKMLKPKLCIPMHGESLHLSRHAQLAKDVGIKKTCILNNGDVLLINKKESFIIDQVYTGEMVLDGNKITAIDSSAVRQRRKISYGGLVVVSVVLDDHGSLLAIPNTTLEGIAMACDNEREKLTEMIEDSILKLSDKEMISDNTVKENVRIATRRYIEKKTGKKSQVKIHLARVSV